MVEDLPRKIEDRRGDSVATGGAVLGPGPATTAAGVSLSFECAFLSAAVSLVSLAELAAVVDSDSQILGSRFTAFLLADFFLAGDFEWHRTQSHLPRGTFNQHVKSLTNSRFKSNYSIP